jgi:tetratricopeptide (TPR) repeat protein
MKKLLILAPVLAVLYAGIFLWQERLFAEREQVLSFVPAARFLRACGGYWRQLTAEAIFVKTAVFLGGLRPGSNKEAYAPALANNYRQITLLYPEFRDPYYFTQGYLPYINEKAAKAANDILATGLATYPDSYELRLFMGFNYLNNLNEPLQAAEVFREAGQRPQAPPVFAYLAALFSADGGDLQAALITLQMLNEAENDATVKDRYKHEIALLEKAIGLFQAAKRYQAAHGEFPDIPERLIPDYVKEIPEFMPYFQLVWQPPQVRLQRPAPAQLDRYKGQKGAKDGVPFL